MYQAEFTTKTVIPTSELRGWGTTANFLVPTSYLGVIDQKGYSEPEADDKLNIALIVGLTVGLVA